jgi:AbrB family looped-hinge helix DNA binding protein
MDRLSFIRPLSPRGQVVIPKDIRTYLGLKEGSQVVFEVQDGTVSVHAPVAETALLEDFFGTPKLAGPADTKRLKKMILEQYDDDIP